MTDDDPDGAAPAPVRIQATPGRCLCAADADGTLLEFRIVRNVVDGASTRIIAYCPLCRDGKMITVSRMRDIHNVSFDED